MRRPRSGVQALFAWLVALSWRRQLLAALGLGLLSALALPPLHLVPVLLLSVPGLLVLAAAQPRWQRAAWIGFLWGWGQGVAGIWWVTEAILMDAATWWWLVPLAAPALAAGLALFAIPPVLVARALPPGWPRLAAFAGLWVLGEMARGWLATGFPWNLTGTVWAFAALPVQGAALIGVHGLSLVTMLLAGLPLLRGWRVWALGGLVLAGFAGFGAWRLAQPAPPDQPVELVLVQGNVAQEVKWRQDRRMPIFQHYLAMTEAAARAARAAAPGRHIAVIWSETASPFLLTQDPEARRMVAAALPETATLLAGTVRAAWDPQGRLSAVWNSLAVLDASGEVAAVYDKSHLVPFGEYMPLAGILPIRLVAGSMDFSAGPGPVTLQAPGLPPFGALICYEVIFPGAVVPRPRPDWLVNITNDAWFGVSSGPWQHLAAARLRAVEEGLPLARAAQTGISALFDAKGRRLAMLPTGETGTLTLPLPGAEPPTPFARFGLALPGLAAAICLLLGIGWGTRRGVQRPGRGVAGRDSRF
ncbi:apolipoprotein N-acyltransferase [Roseicella sp. DB1501]|uniref:apolipoprotein N-acyltransferase n=1 Tax=Roseicella sp. DB1501 TaxID=2730925 RepID=UPI0034A03667